MRRIGITVAPPFPSGAFVGSIINTLSVVGALTSTTAAIVGQVSLALSVSGLFSETAADALDPTLPVGFNGLASSSNITWSWDPSADLHTGTGAAAGVKNYDLELKVNGGAANIQVVTAPAPSALPQPTNLDVGGFGGMVITQTGNDVEIVGGGPDGIGPGSDEHPFRYWTVTNDFRLTCYVASMSGNIALPDYAIAGLICRENTSPQGDSRMFAVFQHFRTNNKMVHGLYRTGGSGTWTDFPETQPGINAPAWVQIERAGNVFTARTSFDGLEWEDLFEITLAWNSTLRVGGFVTSFSSLPFTAVLRDLSVTQSTRVQYVQTVAEGDVVDARIRARDLVVATPNVSEYSQTLTRTATSTYTKWHPGFYAEGNFRVKIPARDPFFIGNLDYWLSQRAAEKAIYPFLVGTSLIINWGVLEPTTQANYTAGFGLVDEMLDMHEFYDLRMTLEQWSFDYYSSGPPSSPQSSDNPPLPDYVIDRGDMAYALRTDGWWYVSPQYWRKHSGVLLTMQDYINMLNAYGERYNSHPYMEMYQTYEWAQMASDLQNYDKDNVREAVELLINNGKTNWPNTLMTPLSNYLFANSQADVDAHRDMQALMSTKKWGHGLPDALPMPYTGTGDLIVRGAGVQSPAWPGTFNYGTIDYRGVIAGIGCHNEYLAGYYEAVGGRNAVFPYMRDTMRCSHLCWSAAIGLGLGGGEDWEDILPYVATFSPVLNPAAYNCPTDLGGSCQS